MSNVTKETVEHVAGLARLSLNQSEVEMYQKDLGKILSHIDELQKVDTSGVKEFLNPMRENTAFYEQDAVLRKDEVRSSLGSAEVLKNAPDSAYDQFKLEAVIDSE